MRARRTGGAFCCLPRRVRRARRDPRADAIAESTRASGFRRLRLRAVAVRIFSVCVSLKINKLSRGSSVHSLDSLARSTKTALCSGATHALLYLRVLFRGPHRVAEADPLALGSLPDGRGLLVQLTLPAADAPCLLLLLKHTRTQQRQRVSRSLKSGAAKVIFDGNSRTIDMRVMR